MTVVTIRMIWSASNAFSCFAMMAIGIVNSPLKLIGVINKNTPIKDGIRNIIIVAKLLRGAVFCSASKLI